LGNTGRNRRKISVYTVSKRLCGSAYQRTRLCAISPAEDTAAILTAASRHFRCAAKAPAYQKQHAAFVIADRDDNDSYFQKQG